MAGREKLILSFVLTTCLKKTPERVNSVGYFSKSVAREYLYRCARFEHHELN